MRWSRGPGFFGSYTFVNKLGEKGWVDDELAPLWFVSGGRLSRDRLLQRSAGFFQGRDFVPNVDQHVAKSLQLRLVADRLSMTGGDDRVVFLLPSSGTLCDK